MSNLSFVFWQNILSPHQTPFIRSLAELGHEVTVASQESMSPDRLAMGWEVPDLGCARVVISPDAREIRQLVEGSSKEAVHIMAGARWYPLGNCALRHCIAAKRRVGILSEAPDPGGILSWGRRIKYTLERCSKGLHYDFVLAMGDLGVKWFRSCGYSARGVFPFAYVTEPANATPMTPDSALVSVLFVGRLVSLKGLDLLLRAFAEVAPGLARLQLVGTGPEEAHLRRVATELGIADSVVWAGGLKNAMVFEAMKQADVLVLPSRKDGWGAVVNESLMAGTPVICSSACGAADLIRQPWLGSVFRAGCLEDLANELKLWINFGNRSQVERDRIRDWACCISGQCVAEYFAAIVDHVYWHYPRPEAPWRAITRTSGV